MKAIKGFAVQGTPKITLDRINAASTLSVTPLGFNLYRVTGGAEAHIVNLTAPKGAGVCDCADHRFRDTVCKHQFAVAGYIVTNKVQ